MSTSGALPCCAASSTLLVRSVVSNPVRLTVTPAEVPQPSSSFTQAEELSNWGYGSQMVYVPLAADEPPPEEEQPARPVATASAARPSPRARRRAGKVRMG